MSLHELLVALAVGGVVTLATYTTLEQGLRTYEVGAARAETQAAARNAVARLATELRYAGRGGRWTGEAITIAEPARIAFASDVNQDGVTDDHGERITWQLVGSILRRNGGTGAGAQPIINGVRTFLLRYFDADGVPTTDVGAVSIVDIALVTESAWTTSSLAEGVATQAGTRVRLRNR